MNVIESYWKDISQKLAAEHPETKAPAEWTRSEAKSFVNKLQNKTGKSVSTTTFRRIFKEGHLGTVSTKDIFAQYFNYPTHGDYIKEEIKNKKISSFWFLLLPISLVLGMVAKNWDSLTTVPEATTEQSQIADVIEKAVTDQFIAFKSIPNFESSLENLKEVYLPSGSAYQDITSILTRQSGLNWILNNPANPSTAQLIKVVVDSINENQAFATTVEHWRLDWFNQAAQREEYKYETTNEQKYILVKEAQGQQWKILQNSYSGNKFRYIPKYIHCDSLAAQTIDLSIIKQTVRTAVENDGLELALRIMDCYYRNHANQKFPDALSLLLSEKTKLLRAINTDEIDKVAFEIKKAALYKQVLDFLKKL